MNTPLNILVTLNEAYIPCLNVMLTSLLDSNPRGSFRVYLLHTAVREEALADTRRILAGRGALTAVQADPRGLEGAPTTSRYPKEIYYRIFAARYLPDTLDRALYLDPDLVVANKEENRELDVRRLREAGVPVWVTDIESVDQALASMERLVTSALGVAIPPWLTQARAAWSAPAPPAVMAVAVPIWRDPWMVVGRSTFTGDLLARAGLRNVFEEADGRYPHVDATAIDAAGADVVLLPDEPYVFTADDGPEVFERTPTRLVDGRLLTWYGPSLVDSRTMLDTLVAALAGT